MEPKTKKRLLNPTENIPHTPSNDSWPRFLVIEPVEEKGLDKVSPFAIQKGVQGLAGTPKSIKKLRSGALLVEVSSRSHSDNLLKSKTLAYVPIKVSPHRALNYQKGVIRCEGLDKATDEEMKELSKQNVSDVHRITITKQGKRIQTNTYIVTFQQPSLPSKLRIGYIETVVKPYIPNPLRCFKCQRLGHHRANCRSREVCARCLGTDHDKGSCSMDPKCANCEGSQSRIQLA